MFERLKQIREAIGSHDAASWVSHWLIAIIPCVLIGLWTPVAAMVLARAILVVMAGREGLNWQSHYQKLDPIRRYTRDGIMDLVGPVLNDVVWTYVVIYG